MSTVTAEEISQVYGLLASSATAKRAKKKRDPRDTSSTIAAAKKQSKAREAAAIKALGHPPRCADAHLRNARAI